MVNRLSLDFDGAIQALIPLITGWQRPQDLFCLHAMIGLSDSHLVKRGHALKSWRFRQVMAAIRPMLGSSRIQRIRVIYFPCMSKVLFLPFAFTISNRVSFPRCL